MSNQIKYRNKKQSFINRNVDVATGPEFWSIEGKEMPFTSFEVPANTNFPNHKQDSEQITYVLAGKLFFTSGNPAYRLAKEDCVLIPGNIDHQVWTEKSSAKPIDAWSPVNKVHNPDKNSLTK